MSTTYPLGFNSSMYNGLVQFGILTQSLFPQYHNLTMTDTVNAVLNLTKRDPTVNLTKIFEPSLIKAGHAGTDPVLILTLVKAVLGEVPHTDGDKGLVDAFIIIFVVTILCVALRLYQRRFFMPGGFQPEDWAMIGAMFPVIALNIVFTLLTTKGYGNLSIHIWDVSYDGFLRCMRYLFASEIIYPFALFAVRHSLHLFYLRLTMGRQALRITVHVLIGANVACMIFSVITIIFQCTDMISWWDQPLEATCPNRSILFLLGGIFIIVTDICTVLLAIPLVYNIKMPLRKKLVVCFIFSLGFLACFASINRVVRVKQFFEIQSQLGDVTYESAHITSGIWSLLEVDLAVMVSCIPALKSFALSIVENRRRKTDRRNRRLRSPVSEGTEVESIGSVKHWRWMSTLFGAAGRVYSKVLPSSLKSGSDGTTAVGTQFSEKEKASSRKSKAAEAMAGIDDLPV